MYVTFLAVGGDTPGIEASDATTSAEVTSFNVGGQPDDVAFSPDSTRAYITNLATGKLYVIDTATNAVLAKPVIDPPNGWYDPGFPTDLGATNDGTRAYVAV